MANDLAPPAVEWIEFGRYARWIFGTDDHAEQRRQFSHWCGWFGYDEGDQPNRIAGRVWWVRSSLK